MPRVYLRIRRSVRKAHKNWPLKKVKKIASMTYNKIRKTNKKLPRLRKGH